MTDELRRLKTRLTRKNNALNKADTPEEVEKAADAVVKECHYAKGVFERKGYPDCHHDWDRAHSDAHFAKQGAGVMKGGRAW